MVGAIEIDALFIDCPGSIEERQHPVMKNVDEPNQSRIVCVPQTIACEISQMLRQGSVGPKHTQEVHGHPNHPFTHFNTFETRWSERKRWNLAKAQKILFQANRPSDSRPGAVFGL